MVLVPVLRGWILILHGLMVLTDCRSLLAALVQLGALALVKWQDRGSFLPFDRREAGLHPVFCMFVVLLVLTDCEYC